DAHTLTAGWLANRNAVMALAFGLAALLAHHLWREGWKPGVWASPLLLALSLASAEAGLGTAAYLGAYGLCLERERGWRRWATLAPAGLVLALWAALYRLGGYGTRSSGLYLDP